MPRNSSAPKILDAIKDYLRTKIGLKSESVGDDFIHRAIEQRVLASRSPNLIAYFASLQTSATELQALTESLLIPETWFFRNKVAFEFFRSHVLSKRSDIPHHRPLRILSLPCSTGEEPYSLVITLLELGMSPKNFRVDAVDISHQSIQYARRAIYGQYSFRQSNPSDYKRYFQFIPKGYKLDSYIVNQVHFTQGNILDPLFFTRRKAYHIIFCRNLLIYFDHQARHKTLRILNQLLYEKGLLFVGHAESSQIKHRHLKLINQPSVFAYQKVKPITQPQVITTSHSSTSYFTPNLTPSSEHYLQKMPGVKARTSQKSQTSLEDQSLADSFPKHSFFLSQSIQSSPPPTLSTLDSQRETFAKDRSYQPRSSSAEQQKEKSILEIARQAANMGQLDEALHLCQDYCQQHPTSPEVYLLLGEIYQAQSQDQLAIHALEKAIYLNASYYDALVQLTLLKESAGELARAANLRQRIQRLSEQDADEHASQKSQDMRP